MTRCTDAPLRSEIRRLPLTARRRRARAFRKVLDAMLDSGLFEKPALDGAGRVVLVPKGGSNARCGSETPTTLGKARRALQKGQTGNDPPPDPPIIVTDGC